MWRSHLLKYVYLPGQIVTANVPDTFRKENWHVDQKLLNHRFVRYVFQEDCRQADSKDWRRFLSGRRRP
jgi:hypothetical protein